MNTVQSLKKALPYLLGIVIMGASSGLYAAEIKTIEFSDLLTGAGEPVSLILDDEDPLTQATFRELISEGATIAVIKSESPKGPVYHFFDAGELDRAIAGIGMINPATNLPIKPDDIMKYKIVNLATPPQRVLPGGGVAVPVVSPVSTPIPLSPIVVKPVAVRPSRVVLRPEVAEELSPEEAALIKIIEFPELLTSTGKPASLVLDEKESYTGKTFRDLIASGNLITALRIPILAGLPEYRFFDAQEWDKFLARAGLKLIDEVRYKIADVASLPQRVSPEGQVIVRRAEAPIMPPAPGIPRSTLVSKPAAAAAGPSRVEPRPVAGAKKLSEAELMVSNVNLIGSPEPELPVKKQALASATARVSADLIESENLVNAFSKTREFHSIAMEPFKPVTYRMNLVQFNVDFDESAKFDREFVTHLLQDALKVATEQALRSSDLAFKLQSFGIVRGHVAAIFVSTEAFSNVVRNIERIFLASDAVQSLRHARVINSIRKVPYDPIVQIAKGGAGQEGAGVPVTSGASFHLASDRVRAQVQFTDKK